MAVVLVGASVFFVTATDRLTFTFCGADAHGQFFEGQATAILHGHLNVPLSAIGPEAIELHHRFYGYFGPAPALLRIPVMAFTSGYPYLAPWYYLLAFALCGVALAGIGRAVQVPSPYDCVFVLSALFALLPLARRLFVYEEAVLWGVTFTLVAVWALLRPSGWWLLLASVAATMAMLSRPTVGAGALAATAVVGTVRRSWPLLVGAAVALGSYITVNAAKFGTLLGPPLEHHLIYRGDPKRLALVQAGPIHPRYIPTNLLQYLRPDTISFTARFPWIEPRMPTLHPVSLLGIARLDNVDPVSSLTVTVPALLVLTVIAFVVTSWERRALLAAVAIGPMLTLMAFAEAQRYLSDFLPVLALGSAVGLAWCCRRARWMLPILALLALAGTLVSFALSSDPTLLCP
jgi:hypothetical protein